MTITKENGQTRVDISELTSWERNPKKISPEGLAKLREQVLSLGMFRPLLVTDEGIVIGGNQRLKVYKELGYTSIWISIIRFEEVETGVRVFVNDVLQLNQDGEPRLFKTKLQAMFAYAMGDNDNAGENDKKQILVLAVETDIKSSGIPLSISTGKPTDIMDLFDVTPSIDNPTVEFTQELLEEHNYVVLYFDNEIDWTQLKTLYPLKTVQSLDSKPGFTKMGVGRVVRGIDFINKIRG